MGTAGRAMGRKVGHHSGMSSKRPLTCDSPCTHRNSAYNSVENTSIHTKILCPKRKHHNLRHWRRERVDMDVNTAHEAFSGPSQRQQPNQGQTHGNFNEDMICTHQMGDITRESSTQRACLQHARKRTNHTNSHFKSPLQTCHCPQADQSQD